MHSLLQLEILTQERGSPRQKGYSMSDEHTGNEMTGTSPGLPPVVARLENGQKTPICVIVVGMAGSGKSSLMAQMQHHANMKKQASSKKKGTEESDEAAENDNQVSLPTYCINLDPATHHLVYEAAIDIRDTINYKEVMKQHNLGPNGAILTSLNLLTTKFDQVMGILEKRAYGNGKAGSEAATVDDNNEDDDIDVDMEYILVDTPGQIEAFTWSASGTIVSESLASAFPTVLCFVVDTVRCASSPSTFISNMLYACSMFYRTRLVFLSLDKKTALRLNKCVLLHDQDASFLFFNNK